MIPYRSIHSRFNLSYRILYPLTIDIKRPSIFLEGFYNKYVYPNRNVGSGYLLNHTALGWTRAVPFVRQLAD